MRRFLKSFRYGEKGFTLIELLIVIAILGVLAIVVVPNVGRFMESGKKAAAQQELGTVQTVIDAAMAEVGLSALGTTTVTAGSGPGTDAFTLTPTNDPIFTGPDLSQVHLKEYLRRTLEGEWTFGNDGLITSGNFPATSPVWHYESSGVNQGWSKP